MKSITGKKPKRTDMTKKEVEVMMAKPLEEVLEKTMEDLADYKQSIDEVGIGATIDLINEEIDGRTNEE